VATEAPFVKAFDDLLAEFFTPLESGAKACGDHSPLLRLGVYSCLLELADVGALSAC
jgi:hypothetical protein